MDDYNQNKTVIELSTDSPINNSYFYSVLELLATDGKIYDTMQKVRATDRELQYYGIEVVNSPYVPELQDLQIDGINIHDMNIFAQRTENLKEDELQKLNGLLNYRKSCGLYDDGISMEELVNMTYGLENCESVENYEIPKVYRGYSISDDYYQTLHFVFRLDIAKDNYSEKYETVTFPSTTAHLNEVARQLGQERIEDCACLKMESVIPKIDGEIFQSMEDISRLNRIATAFTNMSEKERMLFKGLLEKENIRTFSDMLNTVFELSEYEIEENAYSEPDFFKAYLSHFLDSRFDRRWLDGIISPKDIELCQKLNVTVTEYGVISEKGESLYEPVPFDDEKIQDDMKFGGI